jgi:hypothetical protein
MSKPRPKGGWPWLRHIPLPLTVEVAAKLDAKLEGGGICLQDHPTTPETLDRS